MVETILTAAVSAAVTGVVTLACSIISNNRAMALVQYQIEELKKEVGKHNKVVERTYILESKHELLEEKISVANHRISDLENR